MAPTSSSPRAGRATWIWPWSACARSGTPSPARYWVPGQFDNPDNVETHYALHRARDLGADGRARGASAPSSTRRARGGLLTGVGKYLRQQDPAVRLYAVEPAECALLARREWGHHGIEGIGDGFVPRNLDVSQLTGVITTTTEESVATARRLSAEEGIFCGISSGCNVAAALKLARAHPELPSIVTVINDTGQRYFTTALCGEDKHVDIPEREHPMDDYTTKQLDRYQRNWRSSPLGPSTRRARRRAGRETRRA